MTKSSPTTRCSRAVLGLVAALAVLPSVRAQTMTPIPGDPVATPSGKISGKLLASGVKAYLGIPYATAPVRELRWRETQPPKPLAGVYNADRFAPECIQVLRRHNLNHYFGEEPTSEDCLYLNIWVPASTKPDARLPVLVYIYGGGFTIGSSGMALYGGENVARKQAVFVGPLGRDRPASRGQALTRSASCAGALGTCITAGLAQRHAALD